MPNPPCPHCGHELHLTPKRKARCKQCGRDVYVRSEGQVFGGRPLTEKEVLAEDTFLVLADRGVTASDYRSMEAELTERFGHAPQSTDVIWGLYQQFKLENPGQASGLALPMANFLVAEGKNPASLLRVHATESLQALARAAASDDIIANEVEVFATGCCQNCEKLDAKLLPIPVALETNPLPNPTCTRMTGGFTFCTCHYEHVIDWQGMGMVQPPQGMVATPDGPRSRPVPWREPKYPKGGALDDAMSAPSPPRTESDPRLRPTPIKKSFWERFWGD